MTTNFFCYKPNGEQTKITKDYSGRVYQDGCDLGIQVRKDGNIYDKYGNFLSDEPLLIYLTMIGIKKWYYKNLDFFKVFSWLLFYFFYNIFAFNII